MKKSIFAIVLSVVLVLCAIAQAEGSYQLIMELAQGQYPYVEGNLLTVNNENGRKVIYDQTGNLFSDLEFWRVNPGFSRINVDGKNVEYYEVFTENGMGAYGANSEMYIPCLYDDVKVLSDRWSIGIVLEVTESEEDYDYFGSGEKYIITYGDVYYKGEKIGKIEGRFSNSYSEAYGDYLCVQMQDGARIAYDAGFNAREIEQVKEYTSDFTGFHVVHNPTGQYAFEEGCTLKEDEVKSKYYFDEDRSVLVDLYGNDVFKVSEPGIVEVGDFIGGYAIATIYRDYQHKYCVIDENGKVIIPSEYDIYTAEDSCRYGEGILANGYQLIGVDLDKYGFMDAEGNIVCPVEYSSLSIESKSDCFLVLNSGEVISAAIGKVPDVKGHGYISSEYRSTPCLVVENTEGKLGVIDVYGNTLIPFEAYSDITLTFDGKACLVKYPSGNAAFYSLNFEEKEQVVVEEEQPGNWICACGSENNTNFCPNCGSKRG